MAILGTDVEFKDLFEIPIDGIYLKDVNIIASMGAEFNNTKIIPR